MSVTPRNNTSKILFIILGVLALIAIGVFLGFKREPYTTWKEDQSKLTLNKHGHLLALSQFYQQHAPQMKQQAWRTWKADEPPFANQRQHLLFVYDNSNMTTSQFNQLLAWVAQGNHVVMPVNDYVTPETDENPSEKQDDEVFPEAWNQLDVPEEQTANIAAWAKLTFVKRDWEKQPAPLLPQCNDYLNQLDTAEKQIGSKTTLSTKERASLQAVCSQNLSSIALPEGKTVWWLNQYGQEAGFKIEPSKNVLWQSKGAAGSQMVRIQHGQGSVVLVNSMLGLSNPSDPRSPNSDLNRFDHAYLASYLAQGKQEVWFVNRVGTTVQSAPPLWKKLWQFSPLFCGVLLLLFALFVWRSAHRQGVIKQLTRHEDRQLKQYLQAQGEFLWHKQQRVQVLSQLQQQLWQEWQRRIPGLSTFTKAEQLKAIQRIISAPDNDIELWLQALPAKPTTQEWLAYLQAHQHIRNAT